MFTAKWCSSCPRAYAYLKSKNINFKAIDIDKDKISPKVQDFINKNGIPALQKKDGMLATANEIYSIYEVH